MHIVFLTDNFPPEKNAPASRTYEHVREWVKFGHNVTVITCVPNFPTGKVFPGYKNRLFQRETIDGIDVVRVWSFMAANNGFFYRSIDYVSFMISSIIAILFIRKIDIIVGTSPQFFTACSAYISSLFKRKPWIFEVRDLWPESIKAVGALDNNYIIRFLERIELFLYHKADFVVCVTKSHKSDLISRGIDRTKISVITNGIDLELFLPSTKDTWLINKYKLNGCFVIGYIGTFGLAHGLITIMRAAKILQENYQNKKIKFIFLGDGAEKVMLQKYIEKESLKNVIIIDSVSRLEMPKFWSILDASVIHLKREKIFENVIPSKMFEAIGMGIPLLHGVLGESKKIVEDMQVGLCFMPESENDFIDKLIIMEKEHELCKRMSNNAQAGAYQYDRRKLSHEMLKIIENIVALD